MGKTALLIIDMQNDFCLPGHPLKSKALCQWSHKLKKLLMQAGNGVCLSYILSATTVQMAVM